MFNLGNLQSQSLTKTYPYITIDDNKKKVDDLQKELNGYIKTDAGKVQSALDNNTQALKDLREIIIMSKSSRK